MKLDEVQTEGQKMLEANVTKVVTLLLVHPNTGLAKSCLERPSPVVFRKVKFAPD